MMRRRPVWSARVGGWRALRDYAGIAADVVATIVIGLLITVLVVMLNPSLDAVTTGLASGTLGAFLDP